jgi:exopolyphosphatase/guanosine-5'-triphosphate,3'-diphosphate pyrophosphatase
LAWDISLINGFQEAEFIAKGVTHAIPDLQNEPYLIIDIGGGSIEFIIAQEGQVIWKGSFLIGVALLSNRFQYSDPIQAGEVVAMTSYLKDQLWELSAALERYPSRILVGASGTFDVLENFIEDREKGDTYSRFQTTFFEPLYHKLLATTVIDRMRMPEIPLERVEMLIPALILIHTVVDIAQIKEIIVSAYALKEGVLSEMISAE